jgi:hypothetical protein
MVRLNIVVFAPIPSASENIRRRREPRIPPKRPQRIAQIRTEIHQPAHLPRRPCVFAHSHYRAEFPPRSGFAAIRGRHIEVKLDFVVQLVIKSFFPKEIRDFPPHD